MFLRSKQKVIKTMGKAHFSPSAQKHCVVLPDNKIYLTTIETIPSIVVSIVANIALSMPPPQPFL